jgi:predicted RNA-binding Zn ribbon-like protein
MTPRSAANDVTRMRRVGGNLALDFVNTRSGPPDGAPTDEALLEYADFIAWGRYVGLVSAAESRQLSELADTDPRDAERVFRRAFDVRESLATLFLAIASGRAPSVSDLSELGRAETDALGHGQLARSGRGFVWEWQAGSALAGPLWPIVHAAVELLGSDRLNRIKRCAGCSFLFVDESKNGSRRWCSMADCGTDAKVRLYVARRASKRAGRAAD